MSKKNGLATMVKVRKTRTTRVRDKPSVRSIVQEVLREKRAKEAQKD